MHRDFKLWTAIEQQSSPIPLYRAMWGYADLPASLKIHPTIGPTLRIGSMVCRTSRLPSIQSPLFPILANPIFPPGVETGPFRRLLERGLFQAFHFLEADNWPTIAILMQPEGQYRLKFWQALQLCHYFRSLGPRRTTDDSRHSTKYIAREESLSVTLSPRYIPCW